MRDNSNLKSSDTEQKQNGKKYDVISNMKPVKTKKSYTQKRIVTDSLVVTSHSGVTRVSVIRGGNWGCRPYFSL